MDKTIKQDHGMIKECRKYCRSQECDSCVNFDNLDLSSEEMANLQRAASDLMESLMDALKPLMDALIEFAKKEWPLYEALTDLEQEMPVDISKDTKGYTCDLCGIEEDSDHILRSGRDTRGVDWQLCPHCIKMIKSLSDLEEAPDDDQG